MPVYVYKCKECKREQELVVRFEDRDDQRCALEYDEFRVYPDPQTLETYVCGGELEREEMPLTSRTPGAWKV